MLNVFFLVSLVAGACALVLGLAIWLADNQTVSRRLVVLGFPALAAGAYDWLFVPPVHSLAVESPEGFAAIGLVFAATATTLALMIRAKR
jgi:hypothetical protein